MKPVETCARCGEPLARIGTADGAPYVVMLVVGAIFVPIELVLAARDAPAWTVPAVGGIALIVAALLLPRMKGAIIGFLWAVDAP